MNGSSAASKRKPPVVIARSSDSVRVEARGQAFGALTGAPGLGVADAIDPASESPEPPTWLARANCDALPIDPVRKGHQAP